MQMRTSVKIIAVLLVLLIILLTATIIVMHKMESEKDGSDSTTGTVTAENTDIPGSGTAGGDDTVPGSSEPDETENDNKPSTGETTEKPDTDPDESNNDTDHKDDIDTDPVKPSMPEDFSFSKELNSNTGTLLNLRAVCKGAANGDGKVDLTVLLYLDYNSLFMGARNNCRLSVDDVSETFSVPSISEEQLASHTQFLCKVEKTCNYGETVEIYARLPFRGTYSDVKIDVLEIDGSLKIS